jgi:hypothetical protein
MDALEATPDAQTGMVRARIRLLPDRLGSDVRRVAFPLFGVAIAIGTAVAALIPGALPLAVRVVVGGLSGGAVGVGLTALAFRGEARAAYEAFSWLGRWELDRFIARTGGPLPLEPRDAAAWLAAHPLADVRDRTEVLAVAGRIDAAERELASAPPPETAEVRAERTSQAAWLAWLARGSRSPMPRDVLAELRGDARTRTEIRLALHETRFRLEDGRSDWARPLADVRPKVPPGVRAILVRDLWLPMFLAETVVSSVVAVPALLLLDAL